MLELEAPPLPWHSALGWLLGDVCCPCREPKKLLNHFSLGCLPLTSLCCLQVSGWCVPLWATCPGKEPEEVLSPTLQPGPQEGQILLQQGKLLSGSEAGTPAGRDLEYCLCACTEAREDTARYSISMRNSRFKDCCLTVLVYNRSSWSKLGL